MALTELFAISADTLDALVEVLGLEEVQKRKHPTRIGGADVLAIEIPYSGGSVRALSVWPLTGAKFFTCVDQK